MPTYQHMIEYDRPVVYKTFDDATNKTHPLVAGLGSSALVTTSRFTHIFNEWTYGSFTLEIWVKPLTDGVVTILGHDDDGIVYDGTAKTISFSVKDTAGTIVTTTQRALSTVMYVVAQYTGYSISLLVNGLQSESEVTLPLQTTGPLRSGAGKMAIDALALYDYLLNDNQMESHFYSANEFPILEDVYSGAENYFALTDAQEDTLVVLNYPNWFVGYLEGLAVNSTGSLINDIGVDAGVWTTSVLLPDDVTLVGSKITYEYAGTAPKVESSLDGVTWQTINNNYILGVPTDASLPDADPLVRFTFAEDTELIAVRIVVYRNNVSAGTKSSRSLVLARPAVSANELSYPYAQDNNAGALVLGSSLKINGDTPVQAVSFWYLGDEPTAGSKNGGSGHIDGQWNFYLRTFASSTDTINVVTNYNGRVAHVCTWSQAPNTAALYSSHFVKPTISVPEDDQIEFDEVDNGVKAYQNNWLML